MARKTNGPKVRIELTQEQRAQIRQATGKDLEAVELTPEPLEERIAPLPYIEQSS